MAFTTAKAHAARMQGRHKKLATGQLRAVAQSGFTKLLARDYSACFDFCEFKRSLLGFHRTSTSASNCLPNGLVSVLSDNSDIALEHCARCGLYQRLDGLVSLRFFECHCGPLFNSGRILSRTAVLSFSAAPCCARCSTARQRRRVAEMTSLYCDSRVKSGRGYSPMSGRISD
jgi:hypothetical protein